jgi:hypothetical protein
MRLHKLMFAMAVLLLLTLPLSALELRFGAGKTRSISIDELRQAPQTAFDTVREKGNTRQTDLWEGIDMLPWMRAMNADNWHSLAFISSDGYRISMHRAELEAMPSFIAMRDRDGYLGEDELRLIFPQRRDNLWVRGLSAIELLAFDPLPPPRQIFVWEDTLSGTISTRSSQEAMALAEVMHKLFRLDSGSVVFAGDSGEAVRLEYPSHLGNAMLTMEAGKLVLSGKSLPSSVCPEGIVYIQCGPQAFILAEALPLLPDLGKYLQWETGGSAPSMRLVTPSIQPFEPGSETQKIKPGSWIELR